MKLAKPQVDIGLATNNLEPMLAFWQGKMGVPFDHVLPIRKGQKQHRHDLLGSVLKINDFADPLPAAPRAGYAEVFIARPGTSNIQVFRVDEAHAAVLASGGREALAPVTLGTTARISMVLDPDGNWIELSQRASIVGALT